MMPFSISNCIASSMASSLAPSLAACKANWRIRMRRLLTSVRAPSVVWIMALSSSELAMAWFNPANWARICSEITRPAGLSAPLLIRKPDDNRANDSANLLLVSSKFRRLLTAGILLLIRKLMVTPFG